MLVYAWPIPTIHITFHTFVTWMYTPVPYASNNSFADGSAGQCSNAVYGLDWSTFTGRRNWKCCPKCISNLDRSSSAVHVLCIKMFSNTSLSSFNCFILCAVGGLIASPLLASRMMANFFFTGLLNL